jgi:hypothetical protein
MQWFAAIRRNRLCRDAAICTASSSEPPCQPLGARRRRRRILHPCRCCAVDRGRAPHDHAAHAAGGMDFPQPRRSAKHVPRGLRRRAAAARRPPHAAGAAGAVGVGLAPGAGGRVPIPRTASVRGGGLAAAAVGSPGRRAPRGERPLRGLQALQKGRARRRRPRWPRCRSAAVAVRCEQKGGRNIEVSLCKQTGDVLKDCPGFSRRIRTCFLRRCLVLRPLRRLAGPRRRCSEGRPPRRRHH